MLGTQASGAQVEPLCLTSYNDSSRVDIRHPATIGMALGVAYIVTKLRRFATQITLQYMFSFDYKVNLL